MSRSSGLQWWLWERRWAVGISATVAVMVVGIAIESNHSSPPGSASTADTSTPEQQASVPTPTPMSDGVKVSTLMQTIQNQGPPLVASANAFWAPVIHADVYGGSVGATQADATGYADALHAFDAAVAAAPVASDLAGQRTQLLGLDAQVEQEIRAIAAAPAAFTYNDPRATALLAAQTSRHDQWTSLTTTLSFQIGLDGCSAITNLDGTMSFTC